MAKCSSATLKDYEDGMPVKEIRAKYNCSMAALYVFLNKHGVEKRIVHGTGKDYVYKHTKLSKEQAEILEPLIISALGAGFTCSEVARLLGCSRSHTARVRATYHIPVSNLGCRRHGEGTIKNGYIVLSVNGREIREHRKVMEDHLGRPLEPTEHVHHINGNRADNRLENLQLRKTYHGAGQAWQCRACGSVDIEAVELDG